MYNRWHEEDGGNISLAEKGKPFTAEEGQIREDSDGQFSDGGCFIYGAQTQG